MTRKRRNTSSPEPDSPPPKRSRPASPELSDYDSDSDDHGRIPHEEPRIDATTGQKGAFPGLGNDGDDDELFYGPANDGIEYLRMVRSEARGVPRLLVAAKETSSNADLSSHEGGYWVEDAYIAASTSEQNISGESSPDAQDEYYKSLLLRFDLVRATLKCTPPIEAINALPKSHPISYPRNSRQARQTWRTLVLTTDPKMVQLACMDSESVLGVIGLLTEVLPGVMRRRQKKQLQHVGAWTWSCLGRCWEVERLNSEEVAELRDLGKAAVAILVEIRDGLDLSAVYQVGEVDVDGSGLEDSDSSPDAKTNREVFLRESSTGVDADNGTTETLSPEAEELARAKERLQSSLTIENGTSLMEVHTSTLEERSAMNDEAPDFDAQIQAILDMIITIVGEKYGQRDLLEFRDIWTEDEPD